MPRVELPIELDERICHCRTGDLHCIGEDATGRFIVVPARYRFFNDGPVKIDYNKIKREIRPLALTRTVALFAWSDDWAG